ncbi:glycophorin-A-like isoform X1 [Mustela nigripes]|uniref:Glycophorin-A n=1 Tax=Mustela putorius furo TaxID=9669 RepID=M3Y5G1_MUSPF|nr:glycophorin-A isoform X1 [Mustela putorius furo]XP_059229085.1 glycophorin-A-like isoform X1 [Mustela nigripes]
MYEKIVIILLLFSGCISAEDQEDAGTQKEQIKLPTETASTPPVKPSPSPPSIRQASSDFTHQPPPDRRKKAKEQIVHPFSEPVIIGIIYAVMLGIITVILAIAFCISQLTKKRSLPVQHSSPENADFEVL